MPLVPKRERKSLWRAAARSSTIGNWQLPDTKQIPQVVAARQIRGAGTSNSGNWAQIRGASAPENSGNRAKKRRLGWGMASLSAKKCGAGINNGRNCLVCRQLRAAQTLPRASAHQGYSRPADMEPVNGSICPLSACRSCSERRIITQQHCVIGSNKFGFIWLFKHPRPLIALILTWIWRPFVWESERR